MNIKILFMSTFCCAFAPFATSLAQERPHDEALFSEVLKYKDPKIIARERTYGRDGSFAGIIRQAIQESL